MPGKAQDSQTNPPSSADSWLNKLGPGLVTGAADDDPSGIATYSQAGAQFGFELLWSLLLTYPLMVGIQMISARIGRVSGHGLATNIRQHYPAWLLYSLVSLLVLANTINIAADLSAMADAVTLILGGSAHLYVVFFGVLSLLLQVFIPYKNYVRILKWLTLVLLAYVATAFMVKIPWSDVLTKTFLPHIQWKPDYITTVVEFQANGQNYSFENGSASDSVDYTVGSDVNVRYDPANPNTAQIDNVVERWLFPVLIIPSMIFAALITDFFAIRSWRRGDDSLYE